MAKKAPPQSSSIDFETGECVEDETNLMRQAQSSLYRLDNPYIGNKRKIVVDIATSLNNHNVKFNTMADVFSGSSVVGLFFKLLGKKVRSNDLLTSSYMNAVAFVENPGLILSDEEMEFLLNNDNPDKQDFVRTLYSNRFTLREALFLDNYRANASVLGKTTWLSSSIPTTVGVKDMHWKLACDLNDMESNGKSVASLKEALAIVAMEHHVMNRCFLGGRLNSGQILAKLEHRLEHQRNDGHEMSFKMPKLPVFASAGCSASNLDCLDFLDSIPEVDLCYLDPPYGGDQSDYASMFAFCEEYVYGQPIELLPHIANSKKFVSKKDFEQHFRNVLEKAAKKSQTIAVSFNDSSWADCDTVTKILGDYKKRIEVVNMDYEYKYRKERSDAVEYLFIAR